MTFFAINTKAIILNSQILRLNEKILKYDLSGSNAREKLAKLTFEELNNLQNTTYTISKYDKNFDTPNKILGTLNSYDSIYNSGISFLKPGDINRDLKLFFKKIYLERDFKFCFGENDCRFKTNVANHNLNISISERICRL